MSATPLKVSSTPMSPLVQLPMGSVVPALLPAGCGLSAHLHNGCEIRFADAVGSAGLRFSGFCALGQSGPFSPAPVWGPLWVVPAFPGQQGARVWLCPRGGCESKAAAEAEASSPRFLMQPLDRAIV